MAAVLLRRIFIQLEYKDLVQDLPHELISNCQIELLNAVQMETNSGIRRKICDAVAELARSCLDADNLNHWHELLKFLFQCCDKGQAELYTSALHIIGVVPGVFGSQLSYCIDVIRQVLVQALESQVTEVSYEAFKAAVAFIVYLDNTATRNRFSDLLPLLLAVMRENIQAQDESCLLKTFIDLGDHCPKFLRPQLESIIELSLNVMKMKELEDSSKQLALELVVTIAENAPAMMRKHSKFLPAIVTQALLFMLEVTDDEDWLTNDNTEDDDDSTSNAIAGETSLDRFANALGGKCVLPHVITNIPNMMQSEDWRYRHAALMAISAIGEGCGKQMQVVLEDVVAAVLPFCQDSHYRVRYAACNALGQMANDFSPSLQRKFHEKVIPALLLALDDFDTPRVQTHAGAALVNFSEQCPKTILVKYLPAIMQKLHKVLKVRLEELVAKGNKLVLEQVVTTIATVADAVEENFVPYYNNFMPLLKFLMVNATVKEFRLLRGKTIECISLIGLAVGQDNFMKDAEEVMDMLVKVQSEQGDMETDDPQVSYMISAWARMCKIIGGGFVRYLPVVMGPLIQAASLKPEIAFVDSEEAEQTFSEDEGWEFVTLADQQKFGIKTAGLEEKCTAMQMLVVYAKDLKEGFAEYAPSITKIMVPHLKFFFHELVRAAAAEILPHLLECVRPKGPQAVQELWVIMSDKLLEAIGLEPDSEIVAIMVDSLCKCIEFLGGTCFTPEQYTKLLGLMKDQLDMCFSRASERRARREEEDYDEQVEEELEEEDETDEQYLRKVADIMHSLFGTHGTTLLPFFDELLPTFAGMLADGRPSAHKQWSLCVFDDLLEYASTSAIKYKEYFLQPMLKCVTDKSAPVRQAASYGIGIMAQFCAKDFSQACIEALPLLTLAIQSPTAKEDIQAINATENSISAVTKVCKYLDPGVVPLDTILPLWLSWLPVTEDKEESPHVYSYLCDLIESNNSIILGADNSHVPRILSIIAEVCVEDALMDSNQVYLRLLSIARHIQASGDVWTLCLQHLTEKQRESLMEALL